MRLMSYRQAARMMREFLPLSEKISHVTLRYRTGRLVAPGLKPYVFAWVGRETSGAANRVPAKAGEHLRLCVIADRANNTQNTQTLFSLLNLCWSGVIFPCLLVT